MGLSDIALFEGLSESDLEVVSQHAVTRPFRKNTVVVTMGDETRSLYVVRGGRLRVYLDDAQGKEMTLSILEAGDTFGELSPLGEGRRLASVMTLEDSELTIISEHAFMRLVTENPALSLRIIGLLVNRVQVLTEELGSLAFNDVYGRVRRLLLKRAEERDGQRITDRLTHQEIAASVGSSREMVTRILKDLREGGYVTVQGKQFVIERDLPSRW